MQIPTELFDYINLPDSSFEWSIISHRCDLGHSVSRMDLNLHSQTWQSILWRHHLVLYIPDTIRDSDTAMLIIGADGQNSILQESLGSTYASRTGMICA